MAEYSHQELRRVFELVVATSANQRSAVLERECGGDLGLRKRLDAMIAALDNGRFLATPTHAGDDHSDAEATLMGDAGRIPTRQDGLREGPGTRIGPYKILQLIGEGGFGSVFMAEQERPVNRKVALKIIKLGMDTRQVVARFEQERQALAMMDHPNIARVLDAGATETGRPYFVMDLVKGDPIAEYCDRNNLSIEDRLELFAQVCLAVQHAHTKGIIHRDIKPSNILVSTLDGKPTAKVIDFGIAKATASKLTEKTLFTEHRQLIGTPEYMSPEQAEGSLDIDTRTDVYSLGVLLYELLTGSTPFDSKSLRSAAYAEIQRIIREVEPPKPSTRLSQQIETIASVAASRRSEPGKLGTAIRGELDWIVMKALEKDRSRRYETANGLAADIRRFLAGEAIVAAPPSSAYRFRKFVRRHKAAVVAGCAVATVLVLGIAGTTIGMIAAKRERLVAVDARMSETEQRRLAESRLGESEATVKFLDDMLAATDPQAQGMNVTVRAVLDQAAISMGRKFEDRPLVAARLHGTIGRTYMGLGVYDVAESHMREALALRVKELGSQNLDTCHALNELGSFLIRNGGHAESEKLLKQAIVDHEKLFGRTHEVTLQSIDYLATLYATQMRAQEAAPLVKEVLDARIATLGIVNVDTLSSMNTLATLYGDLGQFAEAEKLFETALKEQTRLGGAEHPNTLQLMAGSAWMQYWMAMEDASAEGAKPEVKAQRLEKAKTLAEETLRVRTRVLGTDHQDTLISMGNLAAIYRGLGMRSEAMDLSKRELDASIRLLGEAHPDTITSLANFGNSLRDQKKYEEAIQYLERAIRNGKKSLPPDNPGTAFALGWYGSCLRELGRFKEAEGPLTDCLGIVERSMGKSHPIAIQMAIGLGMLYEAWEKAEPGKGYGAKAEEWKNKADAGKAATQGK